MRHAVILVGALAGCFGDRGVRLDVSTPQGTQFVELFLAKSECFELDNQGVPQPCSPSLAWSATAAPRNGTIFDLDFSIDGSGPNSVTIAKVTGDHVVLGLEADKPKSLQRVVLVGYSADPITNPGSANSVAILDNVEVPANHGEIWQVQLEPAPTITDAPTTTTAVRVWRRPGGSATAPSAACVALQRPIDGGVYEFVVPHDDPDCDGMIPECRAFVPNYSSMGTDRNCAVVNDQIALPPACVLGNVACTDGTPRSASCSTLPNHYCVPDALCGTQCRDTFDGNCLRDLLRAGNYDGPRFTCLLPFNNSAGGADPNLCVNNALDRVQLSLATGIGMGGCSGLSIGLPAVPLMFNANPLIGVEPNLTWEISLIDACTFQIKLIGRHDPLDMTTHTMLTAFDLDATTHIVVPAHVTWTPVTDCSAVNPAQFGCHAEGFILGAAPFSCAP